MYPDCNRKVRINGVNSSPTPMEKKKQNAASHTVAMEIFSDVDEDKTVNNFELEIQIIS